MRRLTCEERGLVERHMGLVGTHLRRVMPVRNSPRRDREWEDLFQEGCLGLARAASSYDESKGVPFAAYALKRIHSAVSRALPRVFATVQVPEEVRTSGERVASVVSLEGDPPVRRVQGRHHPFNGNSRKSIGERIREKYDDAVSRAVEEIRRGRGEHRTALVEMLVQGRLLVPNEDHRLGLREIVRETNSTYGQVVWTEKRLTGLVRARLAVDAELAELCFEARKRRAGMGAVLDDAAQARMSAAMDGRFQRILSSSGSERRALLLLRLVERCGLKIEELAHRLLARLNPEHKADFLREAGSIVEGQPGT
ncbi:MAG: sigma factor [Phycisphaerae bacterium]